MKTLEFKERKAIRARVIVDYCKRAGYRGCVCFSCGNASGELVKTGFDTVDVSGRGVLVPNGWWSPEDIHRVWPDLFDATSGHLPLPLMVGLAVAYREYLGGTVSEREYIVPTGSGETVMALKIAFPSVHWVPDYYTGLPGAYYEDKAPMNGIIAALFPTVILK